MKTNFKKEQLQKLVIAIEKSFIKKTVKRKVIEDYMTEFPSYQKIINKVSELLFSLSDNTGFPIAQNYCAIYMADWTTDFTGLSIVKELISTQIA